MLEKTLESPLDCKKIKSINPKGNQSWTFIGGTDAEAEAPILWLPDAKSWLIGKDPDVGKDRRQEEKGTTEDEMVGWHCQLDRHEFEQDPGVGDGQGSLACCSPWDHRVGHHHLILRCVDLVSLLLFFLLHWAACGILVLWPRIKSAPTALEAQWLNCWTTRKSLDCTSYSHSACLSYLGSKTQQDED